MVDKTVVAVIGGGPAGYTAAIRASQLGARAILVEERELGGACLNRACIPTKFLLRSVEVYRLVKDSAGYGIDFIESGFDIASVQLRKGRMVAAIRDGLAGTIEMNGIEVVKGCARLASRGSIEVVDEKGASRCISADRIILATGSRALALKVPGVDGPGIISAEDALNLDCVPQSIIVVGAGMVGVELASILSRLGCRVSLIEIMPHILPGEDAEITTILEGALKKEDVRLYTGAAVGGIDADDKSRRVSITVSNTEKIIEAERIIVAAGYEPYTDSLGLDECGVATGNGRIKVDEYMQTSVPGIYAAGDVTGGFMLAYTGMAEGRAAAENALGKHSRVDYRVVPRCVFTLPELASVGLTEDEARAKHDVKCGRFPFAANPAASIVGERRGMVKIVADRKSGKVLGAHIIGAGAVDLISEATLAVKLGATIDDIKRTLHAHPTLSEAFWEAAMDADGEGIHLKRP